MYVDGISVHNMVGQAVDKGAPVVRARNCTGVDTDCPTVFV